MKTKILVLGILFTTVFPENSFAEGPPASPRLKYLEILKFKDGLGTIKQNNKWGFINKQGQIVIKPAFDFAKVFSNGLAAVEVNNKWGFINKQGSYVIPPKYRLASNFSNDVAFVKSTDKNPQYLLINKSGKILGKYDSKTTKFNEDDYQSTILENPFSEGLCPLLNNNSNYRTTKIKYINNKNNTVFEINGEYAAKFSDGLSLVMQNDHTGYIDKKGKFVIKPQFSRGWSFSENIAYVVDKDESRFYIDKTGAKLKNLSAINFSSASSSENLIPFYQKNDKYPQMYGFTDRNGKIIINQVYFQVSNFSDGLAAVTNKIIKQTDQYVLPKYKWGYIDKKGKKVLDFIYDEAAEFSDDIALVSLNNRFLYINKSGKVIWTFDKDIALEEFTY